MSKNNMVQLTGIWLQTGGDGEKYFSGKLGSAKVLIFKNTYKQKDSHPDYIMYAASPKKKESQGSNESGGDDIPF